jgi:predicted amidohydrolase YtcJ
MQQAETIWHNGRVLTGDMANPAAEALAVREGRLLAVGSSAEILNLAGPETKLHDLQGRFVMPGLVESHTHALWGACRSLYDIYVGYGATLDQLLAAVKERAESLPAGKIVYGGPWQHDMRAEMGSNPRALLDQISTEHPIILADTSQHLVWCNSLALALGGVTKDSPVPEGGVMERDPASGAPNGILAESATASVRALITRSKDEMAEAVRYFVKYFNSMGFTAFKEPMAYETELSTYFEADKRGDLTLHTAAHIVRTSPLGEQAVPYEVMERLRREYRSENLHTDFAKLFLDGVAPGFTASFLDPYLAESGYDVASHDPDATLLLAPEDLSATVAELDRRGFVVKMHAVGDNAIRRGLDAIEAARKANGASGLRHEIAHTNYVSDADLGRFAALGAIAEMSPKMWFPNPATPIQTALLGADRVHKNHRIADLLAAGAELAYGSDWPAAAPDANPWSGLSGMLTRQNADKAYPGILNAEQAISLEQALPIFTINGARTLRMEDQTGSLKAGKWADFIVLDAPLAELAPQEIADMQVRQTVWKGQLVHALD